MVFQPPPVETGQGSFPMACCCCCCYCCCGDSRGQDIYSWFPKASLTRNSPPDGHGDDGDSRAEAHQSGLPVEPDFSTRGDDTQWRYTMPRHNILLLVPAVKRIA